jgi:tetratricopeptide (TPR) repeat protein
VLHRTGDAREAIAAARKAVALDPDDWRHFLRLAFVSWGEERLRAARRVLTLYPRLALAYWFAATVFVARDAFDAALEELRPGCASQDAQRKQHGRFNAVGLHLLHGLVLAAQGADDLALEEFASELAFEEEGQLYARECCANTWYALGSIRLRQGNREEAAAAFHESLRRVPGHSLAMLGLRAASPGASQPEALRQSGNEVDTAIVRAAAFALQGDPAGAAQLCAAALTHAGPGAAGWILPVDPLLHVTAHREAWAPALAVLRDRAS